MPNRVKSGKNKFSRGRKSQNVKKKSQEEEEKDFVNAYCHLLKVKEGRHNLKSQIKVDDRNLEYDEAEAQYLAGCFTQMLILPKAVKEFGTQGVHAAKK